MKPHTQTIRMLVLACLWLGLIPPEAAARQSALLQVLETGLVDWRQGTVSARGVAVPPAAHGDREAASPAELLDVARRSARANLLETVKAIRIDADSWVADRLAGNDQFQSGLEHMVGKAAPIRQEYLSDGTVEIEVRMKMNGGFAQFVLPAEIRHVDSVTAVADATSVPQTTGRPSTSAYTGLIIDASGIDAKPCLVPVVVDESDGVVYGPAFVSREFAVSRAMSGFASTLEAAMHDDRVGARPLIVKAIRTHMAGKTNLVVSSADAARIHSSVRHLNFLRACRVSIVIGPAVHP